jgi:hypothetical protein
MGGCGCGKKKKIISLFASGRPLRRSQPNIPVSNQIIHSSGGQGQNKIEDIEYVTEISPADWGPLLWKFLHILAERLGRSGIESIDRDEAIALDFIVERLPDVLPCPECQIHARTYIRSHSYTFKNLRGQTLQSAARNYFWSFHNSVRESTGKSVIVATVDDCKQLYQAMEWQKCEMEQAVEYFSFGVHHGIIKTDTYKRWMTQVHKLRLITGF